MLRLLISPGLPAAKKDPVGAISRGPSYCAEQLINLTGILLKFGYGLGPVDLAHGTDDQRDDAGISHFHTDARAQLRDP